MDKNIFKNSGNSPILESKSLMENVRDNYLELTKPSTEGLGVVSPSFRDAMTKSEFLLKSASDIYYGAEDPRKEAKNAILGDILAEKYGVTQKNVYNTSTQEYFRKNVSSYIKSATGYDLDANSIWDIFVNKVEEGLSNTFNVAIPNIAYMIQTSSAKSDEERQFLREKYDKKIAEAYKNRRTDYFKEFDSVVDDLLMSTASFLPSVLPSLAVHGIGALLSAPTAGMSNFVSKIMASGWSTLTEGANAMLDMRMEGADEEVALTFGAIYGVIAGLIEAKAGDVIEDKMFGSLKRAGELFNKSGKFLEKDFVGRTATEIIKRRASEYVASFVTEPVEEMAQEFAQQLVTELANKYQESYGEAFTDHKGLNEMIDAVKEVGLETFKGNVLLGLGTNAISLGIDEMTDFKYAKQAKSLAGNDFKVGENTDLNFTRNLRFNNKVKAVEVKEGEGIGSIRVRPLPDGSFFVHPDDAGKAKYATEKAGGKKNFGVYIDVIKDEDVTGDKMDNRETSRIASYQLSDFDDVYVEDNRIVVKDKDYSDAINSIIYGVGDSFNGMVEKNGIMNIKIGDNIVEVARESEVGAQTYETLDEATRNLGGVEREIYLKEQEKNKTYSEAVNSFKNYRKGDMITSYENALKQANAKNTTEIAKANMETAKRINESLFNTFKQVKGIKSDKKALAFANATTVFANRMANALNMTLEQFIGDVKFGEYSVTSEIEAGNIKADTVKEIIDSTSYVDTDNVTHILRGNINNSIIKISKAVDATTAIHEVSHLFLSKADIAKINGFNTIYADKLALDNEGNTNKSTWKVGKETQEAFATDFEKYVRENAVKDSALREVFEQLKMCLAGIRTSLAGELSDETRKMLDELLGEDTVLDAMEIESGELKSEKENNNNQSAISKFKKKNNGTLVLDSEEVEEANKALEGKISRNEDGTVLLSEDVEYPSDFIVGLTDLFYALHGTGRDFDKFMDKYINSSTGIVHGWGHYFAVRGILAKMHAHQSKYTNETTADLYKIISDVKNTSSKIDYITEKLSKFVIDKDSVDTLNEIVKDDIEFSKNNGIRTTRLDSIADDISKLSDNNLKDKSELIEYLAEKKRNYESSIMELESDLIAIEGGEYEKIDNYNLFKVKVPAGKYLDWNKGISKGLVDELLAELKKDPKHFSHEIEQFDNWDETDEDVHTFERIYKYMAGNASAKAVSKIFENLGYKGIVYEDEQIGGLCFVFFDEKFVNDNIVEHWKYKKLSDADNYYSEDIVETDAINRDKYILDDAKYYKDKLKNGGRLSDMQMELVERQDAEGEEMIRVERTIPALFTTAPEVIDEARSATNKYLEEKSKAVEELTDEDWNKIADEWVKKLNKHDINRDDITGNIGFMVKKINAYTTLGMNESVLASWTSKFLGRNGNTEFKKFVKDFSNKTSYLGDVDYSNYNKIDNGQRFPFMTMMAYQLKNGMRVRQVVLDGAKKELLDDAKFFRNEWLIWNGKQEQADAEMEFDNEDSEYNEATRELHEFLYDATLSPRIRKIIKDETFSTDTVNKIIKTGEKIRKENSEKIRRLSDRIKALQEENRQRLTKEESDKLKEEVKDLKKTRRDLFNEIVALDNKNAFLTMRLQLEDVKKKINKIQKISARGGNSDSKTQSVLRFVYSALKNNGALYDKRNTRAKFETFAPQTFETLSKLGIATEDGIEASLDTLTYNELNMLYKAMRDDSKNGRREREAIEELNNAENRRKGYEIVEDMRMEGVEITEEDNPAIEEIMKSHDVDREEAEKIFRQRKMLTKNPSGSVSDKERHMTLIDNALNLNFTIPYTWIGQISKQLRAVIFGLKDKFGKTHYGLNQYREKSLKMEQERFEIADTKLAEIFGINETDKQKRNKKVRKELAKFFDKYGTLPELTEEDDIKDVINTYLREDQREVALNLMKYQNVKNDSVYTKQNLIGIFIRTLNTNSLQHIVTSANNISMAQAMAVRKMFEENPEFDKMREVAYALVDVVGGRFTDVARVAYETENIDLVLEDYYYPNISSDKRINVVFKNNPLGKQVGEKTTNLTNFFVNERDNGQGQPVSLDVITDMDYNIKVQEEYIAGAKMFKDWDEMFNGEANVGGIIRAEYGDKVYNALMQFININKKRVNGELPQVDGLIGRLMSNYSLAKLAFNLSSVLQQPSSLFLALKDYSGLEVSKAFLRVAFGGRKYIEDNIYGKSEQMRHRSQLELGYAKELRNEASVYGKAVNAFAKGATFAMEKVDHFIADVLFDCAYQSELAKGLSESEASTNATQWVMNIQSSTDPKNNALAYSSKNSLMKLILLFTNQLNKQYNMVVSSILEDHGKSIIWTLEALALSTAWICLTTGKFLSPDSDDKDWLEWAKAIGVESLGMIPVIGGDVKGVFDGYYYNNNSSKMGLDVFSKLTQFGMILNEEDKGKKKQKLITAGKNAVYGLEDLVGAPSVFTKRVVQAIGMKNEGHKDFIEVISPLLGSDFMNYYKEGK